MSEKQPPGVSAMSSLLQLRSWRRAHLTLILAFFVVFFIIWNLRRASFVDIDFSSGKFSNTHPIRQHVLQANATYSALLGRQSKKIWEARKAYRKRYEMEPPRGFDKWFEYAQEHKSLIIDDFDEIHERLAPYREWLKSDCATKELDHDYLASNRMIQICIKNGKLKFIGTDNADSDPSLSKMLDFASAIPDMCFMMNTLDEPRILLPADKLVPTLLSKSESSQNSTFCTIPAFMSFAKQSWWTEAVMSCPADSPAKLYPGKPDHSRDHKLLGDWKSSSDLCSYSAPIEHGMLMSPSTLLVSHDAVPVLSNAGLSTNNDIFFPSIWRFDLWDEYKAERDIPWEKKKDNGYWRGSTTGGHATGNTDWVKFQRHRFVDFANDKKNPMADKMDVGFSAVVQCDDEVCDATKDHFQIMPKDRFDVAWKSKIVFDIDGNGLSGRFYPLLRSNSALFRQGIFREWHDSRIQPWLHYVPMSMQLTEVKDVLSYLLGEGEDLLKEVARAGKVMADSTLRREDMKIYFYRLLIEMARE